MNGGSTKVECCLLVSQCMRCQISSVDRIPCISLLATRQGYDEQTKTKTITDRVLLFIQEEVMLVFVPCYAK